jgi:lauroyl/myristoyl acyltransferase
MLGHCGNWELLSLLPKLLGIRVIAPYRVLRPKCLDRVVYRIRVRFGMLLIPDIHIGRYFLRDVVGGLYTFLSDQCPVTVDVDHVHDFLNQRTSFFGGVDRLSVLSGCSVYYLGIHRTVRGNYSFRCTLLRPSSSSSVAAVAVPIPVPIPAVISSSSSFASSPAFGFSSAATTAPASVSISTTETALAPAPAPIFLSHLFKFHLESTIFSDPVSWLWTHKRWKR